MAKLKLLQRRLTDLLYDVIAEAKLDNPRLGMAAHGFIRGRTILSNANAHRRRRFVFNADIEDFFGTINFGRVRGFFIKDKIFKLDPHIATVIAQIACHDNSLPQGSPCSPVISNLVGNILDMRLIALAKAACCTYTRYVDDLTFSSNERLFPNEIATEVSGGHWVPGEKLTAEVERAGFSLNPRKTRMCLSRSRQSVTGLVVNEKPNIDQDYYRYVRSMCAMAFKTGQYHRPQIGDDEKELLANLNPLEGMLSYVYFVRARRDRDQQANKRAGFHAPRAPIDLYRKFLFFKHFVTLENPLIVTEGETDIVYLKAAIKSLAGRHPSLVVEVDGKITPSVKFLKPSGTTRAIMNLGHGATGQTKLIQDYKSNLAKYGYAPLKHPVIVLCDNDTGPKQVFATGANKCGKAISIVSTDLFYYLGENLYLVKVPEGTPAGSRDIEDLFPKELLDIKLDGKSFDKKSDDGGAFTYSKAVFADKVVRANAHTIDFTGFSDLLTRIEACLAHYKALSAPPVVIAVALGASGSRPVS